MGTKCIILSLCKAYNIEKKKNIFKKTKKGIVFRLGLLFQSALVKVLTEI